MRSTYLQWATFIILLFIAENWHLFIGVVYHFPETGIYPGIGNDHNFQGGIFVQGGMLTGSAILALSSLD